MRKWSAQRELQNVCREDQRLSLDHLVMRSAIVFEFQVETRYANLAFRMCIARRRVR